MTTVAMPVTGKISIESNVSEEFTAVEAVFGDGYSQVAPDGLNNQKAIWDVEWRGLSQSEMTTVRAALDSVGLWGIITWTPCNESVQKKFRMVKPGYKRGRNKTTFFVTAQFKQVFDL